MTPRNPVTIRDSLHLEIASKYFFFQYHELPKGISLFPEIRTPNKLCYQKHAFWCYQKGQFKTIPLSIFLFWHEGIKEKWQISSDALISVSIYISVEEAHSQRDLSVDYHEKENVLTSEMSHGKEKMICFHQVLIAKGLLEC